MNIELLNEYKEKGLLMNQFHPTLPLIIWNYTAECQYSGSWDEITLQCRGLITDFDGNTISRGFNKFFNIEEERHVPTDDFEVFEKLDGQYIGVFWYNGEMIVNSRGSFDSIYSREAKRILNEKYPEFINYWSKSPVKEAYSFCLELIGFEQIVVSYPEPDLILTGCFRHICYEPLYNYWEDININQDNEHFIHSTKLNFVKCFSGLDYNNIKQLNWKNSEGFVVRFSNGDRCKIKFEDYVKLHRQMTNLSTKGIWKALMEGEPVSSILNDVPDEFYDKVHAYENNLKYEFIEIEKDTKIRFDFELKPVRNEPNLRKKFAENISKCPYSNILFAMLDGKDYSKMIWKLIEPKFEKL